MVQEQAGETHRGHSSQDVGAGMSVEEGGSLPYWERSSYKGTHTAHAAGTAHALGRGCRKGRGAESGYKRSQEPRSSNVSELTEKAGPR